MKYQYSVIGDNTQENREWLERVGHSRRGSDKGNIIITFSDGGYMCAEFEGNFDKAFNDAVKCLHSDELFKAVSAMREDSDYMQWFITDFSNKLIPTEPMYLCKVKCFNGVLIPYQFHEDGFHIGSGGFHKATLTELQERFKEKER